MKLHILMYFFLFFPFLLLFLLYLTWEGSYYENNSRFKVVLDFKYLSLVQKFSISDKELIEKLNKLLMK